MPNTRAFSVVRTEFTGKVCMIPSANQDTSDVKGYYYQLQIINSVSSTMQGQANIVMLIQTQQKNRKMCRFDSLMSGRIVATLTANLGKILW